MFWRFGGYTNISTIDTILEKPDFTTEDLLDDNDLIQELKSHNTKLIEYLREEKVLEKLLEYVVAPKLEPVAVPDDEEKNEDKEKEKDKGKGLALPFSRPRASSRATDASNSEEDAEKKRNRYAYVAAEVLSSDNWSIYEALMESRELLRAFWAFLKRPAPLDPLQASYFTKVNESLFDKKTEEMIDFLKTVDGAVPNMLGHVDSPNIMDLLLKIISLERIEAGQGIIEWLYAQDAVPILLSYLGPEHNWARQTAAGDFIKAIITVSANASQNEQTCIGPNELTRQLVSKPCVQQLITYMLGGGNPLTVGVGIVIEVIRKNNSDYDPDVGAEVHSPPSSRDPIYLGTLLRLFAENVPNFMKLIGSAPSQKLRLNSTFGEKIEPLGFDRFKSCELMAELLHCSNMGLLNEVGSEELVAERDVERQRLRREGKLVPMREEAPSSEDLTMRMGHSSPEEGRRLEVTNVSDDDGFEEVTRSKEMEEDTSHEFVKAEDEIAHGRSSSFLDKEDDDFVDEPLSSPRLHVRDDDKAEDDKLDDPSLVVAPLSPSKEKAAVPEGPEGADASKIEDEIQEKIEELSFDDEDIKASKQTEQDAGDDIVFKPSMPSVSEPEPRKGTPEPRQVEAPQRVGELSPHPEDTPAPLFSPSRPIMELASASTEQTAVNEPGAPAEQTEGPAEHQANNAEHGEPIISAGHAGHEQEGENGGTMNLVVGDFLKLQFVEYKVVPSILGFFFTYPWNNFLHNVVYDIVQQVFNGPIDRGYNPTLAISLFENADITAAIINGQRASEQSEEKTKTRMGYMGHLTLIAEEVVKFTERHPPELLSESVLDKVMSHEWISYVEGALAETRERDNAILGGVRPEVATSNRAAMPGGGLAGVGLSGLGNLNNQGSSNALAEAGLNGGVDMQGEGGDSGGGGGIGPFAISAGTLMSGFGSSSDEDEDDADENEEDVNNEFRQYTDPLNPGNSSSMNPPSIPPPPPPPPPLNTPPSRARLQLAARLMKRNAAAAAAAGGSEQENGGDGEGEDNTADVANQQRQKPFHERLRDPFADDEEDDEDNSDDEVDESREGGNGGGGSGWGGRGGWWRSVVRRRDRRSGEKFGDGRDDSDDERSEGGVDEDEEFGDFAMPEVADSGGSKEAATSSAEAEQAGWTADEESDAEHEKVLIKPLPVYPASGVGKSSALAGLWPFGSKDKDKDKGQKGEEEKSKEGPEKTQQAQTQQVTEGDKTELNDEGRPVRQAVEAKRRTSIEDPDEEEVVV